MGNLSKYIKLRNIKIKKDNSNAPANVRRHLILYRHKFATVTSLSFPDKWFYAVCKRFYAGWQTLDVAAEQRRNIP